MSPLQRVRDHYLPPDPEAYRRAEPPTGRVIVIAPTRAACETIELAMQLRINTVLEREHGEDIRSLARQGVGFGIMAGTGTGKTLAIRPIAEETLRAPLKVGVVNREREATPETPTWNVVIVTTGIARRWFQDNLIDSNDTLVVDEIHQTSAELELCLALGKRVGCRFVWLSATVDPSVYARYLESAEVLETTAFDPAMSARVEYRAAQPLDFLDDRLIRCLVKERRGVAVFLPTRAEVEEVARELGWRWEQLNTAFYHGGEPIRVIRPFLEGSARKPFVLAMTQAGQSALNIQGLDTVVIYDACYNNVVDRGRNVLTRQHLGANEILQMAGRVHGRVPNGQVYLLTDRDIDFASLSPTPPDFQLAGETERVALTAAALGVDLSQLDLPVPLDRHAYVQALAHLTERGLVHGGRLTGYGRDVEAMPVDRPWGELLVHAADDLIPYVAVAANIESLHRMTREECDLQALVVHGSDHLSGYNVFAEAVNECGYVGQVYGLPRHLFVDEIDDWAQHRGVLVKAIEDVALGTASVMRTLELPLRERLPRVDREVAAKFRDLIARVMPFELVVEGETAAGDRVRLSRSSVCNPYSAVAGRLSYFADRFGIPGAAIEGTNIPLRMIQRYATAGDPVIEFHVRNRRSGLVATRRTAYFGFELSVERSWLTGKIPNELSESARDVLAQAAMDGVTRHPDQAKVSRVVARLDEYWRRSGGSLAAADPARVTEQLRSQLAGVNSWNDFLEVDLELDIDRVLAAEDRGRLDELPASAHVLGDRVPLSYELEGGKPIVYIKLRERQAQRLRQRDLPALDRPIRFIVHRGRREILRADSLHQLRDRLRLLWSDTRRGRPHRRGRRRR
ncbi:MAG: DEAD/DEAH box helicase [Gemmatimonadota bacterium]|nr:MAG: DEAD/DEAH box helicase [Gemmatimonadota bacterium]